MWKYISRRRKSSVCLQRSDKHYQKLTIRLANGENETAIIPPLIMGSLCMIAMHEGMTVEELCHQIVKRKQSNVRLLDVIYLFVAEYFNDALKRQCAESLELKAA
jgi:hypothetical protein